MKKIKRPCSLTIEELEKAKVLKANGLSYNAIALELRRDPKTIKKALVKPEALADITEIREELSEMYEGLARKMINSITDEDISKINAYQRTVSAGIATDKMRLLRDKSTENIDIQSVSMELKARLEHTEALRALLLAKLQSGKDGE